MVPPDPLFMGLLETVSTAILFLIVGQPDIPDIQLTTFEDKDMQDRNLKPTARILLLLGLSAISLSSFATNECRIKYGYNSGSGMNRTDHTKYQYINKGQTVNINRNRMNYVQNLKNNPVKFYLNGAANVTLNKNQVNPTVSYYLNVVKLVKAKCLNDSSTSQPQTPQIMVNTMKAASATAGAIALALRNTFNLGYNEIASLLKSAGYPINQIASALKVSLNNTSAQVGEALKSAGYSINQIASALKSVFGNVAAKVGEGLKAAGYSINQIASALKSAFGNVAAKVGEGLKAAGYSINQIASALKSAFGNVAAKVGEGLKAAGYSINQIAAALKSAFGNVAAKVGEGLKAAGYSINQIASALKSAFNNAADKIAHGLKGAGYTLQQIAETMKNNLGYTREQIKQALLAAGYALSQIEQVLNQLFGQASDSAGQVVAGAMRIRNIFHGTYPYSLVAQRCFHPSGRTLYTTTSLPLPNTNRDLVVTLTGDNLMAASSISGLPRGATARITAGGNCGIQLAIRIPSSVAVNTSGTAYVMAGRQRGPRFNYTVGPIPSQSTSTRIPSTRTGSRGGNTASSNNPDLIPFKVNTSLYKVGTATTLDNQNNLYTALDPFNNSTFCQSVPQGGTARNNMPTANRRTISVPNIVWGVKNDSNQNVTESFTIQLKRGSHVVNSHTINSLNAGQMMTFSFSRPTSQTCVSRVGLGGGCYHCGGRNEGWNDNAGYRIEVDTGNDISERNENNNSSNL